MEERDFTRVDPEGIAAERRDLSRWRRALESMLRWPIGRKIFVGALLIIDVATVASKVAEGDLKSAVAVGVLGLGLIGVIAASQGVARAELNGTQERLEILDEVAPAVALNAALSPDPKQRAIEARRPVDPTLN